VNDIDLLENLEQAQLPPAEQDRLFTLVLAVFKQAIDVRSPKKRPPGKAGLRAEKGYYRLLYLENDFQEKVNNQAAPDPEAIADDWDFIPVILRKLQDIPELQQEIREGIEDALTKVIGTRP
jgi:hypothetical protein